MNKTQLIGRVTADIELKQTTNGNSVVSFTLAVNRRTKDEGTDFISCVVWGKSAENISKFVHKGDRIAIAGRIQTRNYKDKNDRTIYVTEVVADEIEFLESRKRQPSVEIQDEPQKAESIEDFFTEIEDLPF